jgi:nucleoside-diphosphate-sugar epimerase
MPTAIVTGVAGFLGSHLAERLLNDKFKVIGFDNLSTGSPQNVRDLEARYKNFQFHEFDCSLNWTPQIQKLDSETLSQLSFVFHFASPASPPIYQRLNIETIRVNTLGLEQAIQVANQFKAKVIFASTSEVYGDPSVSPQPETYWGNVNSFGERSCYDEAKRCGEAILYSYNSRENTSHGLVRIFNTYGPRMNLADGRVVINLLSQAMQRQKLTVYGDGNQTRSFCYVDDLIDGIVRYAQSPLKEPVNLGNPVEFTILELVNRIKKVLVADDLEVLHLPLPADDPKRRKPDITKALNVLSPWQPKTSLDVGLLKMAEWLKSQDLQNSGNIS